MTKKNNVKRETVDEFVARGGNIEKIPSVEPENKDVNVRRTTTGPATLMTLGEGALFFTEKIKRKKKDKQIDNKEVDYWSSKLPDDVKKKLGL